MTVLVTGGLGKVGSAVVAWLVEKGYEVRIIDTRAEANPPPGTDYRPCDITDYAALREAVRGCQAVVHMAALASPASGCADEVFRINASGTFNVYRAAEVEGIRRVVQASSINAIGLYYGMKRAEPLYFPIDEEHPPQDTDSYSFSKWIVEEIADYHWRRSAISGVSLRFPGVSRFDASPANQPNKVSVSSQIIERAVAMPLEERMAWLDAGLARVDELRAQGMMESRAHIGKIYRNEEGGLSQEERWLHAWRNNLWSAIDERDASQAVEKALSTDYTGSHPLFVNANQNTTGHDAELLAQLFFPRVTMRKRELVGAESLVSNEKASRLIGYAPAYSFI